MTSVFLFSDTWALFIPLIELAGVSFLVSDVRRKVFNMFLLIILFSVVFMAPHNQILKLCYSLCLDILKLI